jgi:hypothetical protein
MTRMARRAAVVVGLVIAAVAASDAAKPDRISSSGYALQSLIANDTAMLGNISDAALAFEHRLQQRVIAQDGLILVDDIPELATVEAFPTTISWSISCSRYFGLNVSFGGGTSDDSGIIEVALSKAAFTDAQCRQLLPILGRKIAAILR